MQHCTKLCKICTCSAHVCACCAHVCTFRDIVATFSRGVLLKSYPKLACDDAPRIPELPCADARACIALSEAYLRHIRGSSAAHHSPPRHCTRRRSADTTRLPCAVARATGNQRSTTRQFNRPLLKRRKPSAFPEHTEETDGAHGEAEGPRNVDHGIRTFSDTLSLRPTLVLAPGFLLPHAESDRKCDCV